MRVAIALLFVIMLAGPASAAFMLEAPMPIGIRMGNGSSGEISYSTFESNTNILFGGATTGGTTSAWSFKVDGQVFVSQVSAPNPNPSYKIDDGNGTMVWEMNGVQYQLNSSLVYNSSLLVMTMRNVDSVPHDAAFRYQWDTYIGNSIGQNDGPEIIAAGEPGDTPGSPGCYSQAEADWAFPQFTMVKMLQTCNGPDTLMDAKGYLVWDPGMGGTQPDRFTMASWGKAVSTSWDFNAANPPPQDVQYDNAVLTWWGYYNPYHLLPGEEQMFVFWYGMGMPPPLAEFFVNAYFTDRPNSGPLENPEDALADATRVRMIEAGQTTFYPFSVANMGGIVGRSAEEQEPTVFDITVAGEAPPGWTYQVVRKDSPQPVDSVALRPQEIADLRLRVSAPVSCTDEGADQAACALGSDAASVNVTVAYHEKPTGFFNPKTSRISHTLFTNTIVKPFYDVQLTTEAEAVTLSPGESATYDMKVTNTGNVRTPVPIELSMLSLLNPGWEAKYDEAKFLLAAGQSKDVKLTITVPSNEAGGDHVLTARAGVSQKTDFDTAEVSLTVLADRAIVITSEDTQQTVPPGGAVVFPVEVTNNGPQPVPVNLQLVMEQPAIAAGWKAELRQAGFPSSLNPGRTATATVTLTAPAGVQAGERAGLLFSVMLTDDNPQVLASLGLAGIAGAVPANTLLSDAGSPVVAPSGTMQFDITAINSGNRDEVLRLLASSLPKGWTAQISPANMRIAPGESGVFSVTVNVAGDALAGATDMAFRLVDRDSVTQFSVARTVQVASLRNAAITAEDLVVRVLPEDKVAFNVKITNNGNLNDKINLAGVPEGFLVESSMPFPIQVDVGKSVWTRLQLTAPSDIASYAMPLTAVTEDGSTFPPGAAGTMTVHVSRPDLGVQNMEVSDADGIHANSLVTVLSRVVNTGEIGARDFVVRLYVDGEPTDSEYRIEYLSAAGATGRASVAVVPLTWVAEGPGPYTLAIRADPDGAVKESRLDNNEQVVQVNVKPGQGSVEALDRLESGKGLKEAPAPWFAPILALGLIVLARRRLS